MGLTATRRLLGRLPMIELGLSVVLLALGFAFLLLHASADIPWIAATVLGLIPLVYRVVMQSLNGKFGVDVVALAAMAGCLALGEYLAGAVIAVMLASGQALETYAQTRAQKELTLLVGRRPRTAHRFRGEEVVTVDVNEVQIGDYLMVKNGDVVPVDGKVEGTAAILDESALTGEARPVSHEHGDRVRSGTINVGPPFRLIAATTAENSTYSGIIQMVEEARTAKAPLVRIADRYAAIFLGLTFVVAAAAWIFSGNPVRALAVLVVATPCPLIIAAPVAIVAGVSRAAKAGVIVKGGAVLEGLSRLTVLLFDKTGTLTAGHAALQAISALPGYSESEVLRFAASLDQLSSHPLAAALRRGAQERGMTLTTPTDVVEQPGSGISGKVENVEVRVGRAGYAGLSPDLAPWETKLRRRAVLESLSIIFVAINGKIAGAVLAGDELRPDAARTVRNLRRSGLKRIIMVTGDHPEIAEATSTALGLDDFLAEHAPDEKAMVVKAERASHGPTAFVGDGINDAPALATADVGIAIGSRGISAASESADAVLVVDRLDNLADAISISRRSMKIALQSIVIGMSLSLLGMVAAGFGFLIPVAGAIFQEGIDVAVILNALRALGGEHRRRPTPELSALSSQLRGEHRRLRTGIDGLREVADRLDRLPVDELRRSLHHAVEFLLHDVLPHEANEERQFYPMIAEHIGGADPTSTMLRTHVEIIHLTRALEQAVRALTDSEISESDLVEFRRLLYALYSVLSLHNAQEDESYISLVDTEIVAAPSPRMTTGV